MIPAVAVAIIVGEVVLGIAAPTIGVILHDKFDDNIPISDSLLRMAFRIPIHSLRKKLANNFDISGCNTEDICDFIRLDNPDLSRAEKIELYKIYTTKEYDTIMADQQSITQDSSSDKSEVPIEEQPYVERKDSFGEALIYFNQIYNSQPPQYWAEKEAELKAKSKSL